MSKYNDRGRVITTQAVDYTSSTVPNSTATAFSAETYIVRLAATSAMHYHVFGGSDTSSTCTSADPLLPAGQYEIVCVTPGQKVSFIIATGGTVSSAAGRVTVTELG